MTGLALPRRSLAARLALVYGAVSVGLVAVLGLGVYFLTERYLNRQVEDDLAGLAEFYAAYTAGAAQTEAQLVALAPQIAGFFAPQADYDVRVFNARNGALLAATRDLGPLPSQAALAELRYRRPTLFVRGSQDLSGRRYAARPAMAGDMTLAVVEVSRGLSEMQSFLTILRGVLLAAGAVALAAALVAALLLARRVTLPLRDMEAATRAIAAGRLDRRLSTGADEVGRLAASINQMAADLARLEAARRDFIAKVSHDLRTPLTAIKGFVVNLQDTAPAEMQAALATMDEQTDRLIRLVDDLLLVSRLQRGALPLERAAVDMAAVARSAAAVARPRAERRGVALVLDLPAVVPAVRGDADRLQQVVVNLLDNALRAAPVGTEVRLAMRGEAGEAVLTVTDSGPGPSPELAGRAFEPYVRGAGGGAGLGLTIARDIVAAHGGRIWLAARAGGGAEAGFALPAGAARDAGADSRQAVPVDLGRGKR